MAAGEISLTLYAVIGVPAWHTTDYAGILTALVVAPHEDEAYSLAKQKLGLTGDGAAGYLWQMQPLRTIYAPRREGA